MSNATFKPVGFAFSAIVAGLAAPAGAEAIQPPAPSNAAAELAAAAARFEPAEPFGEAPAPKGQMDLFR
jgi:hypothetical protein